MYTYIGMHVNRNFYTNVFIFLLSLSLSFTTFSYSSVKLANNVTYERMIKTLEQLKIHALEGSSPLYQVLLGQQRPSTVKQIDDLEFFDNTLNDSQKDAVRFALGSQDVALIHGPPGVRSQIYK